MTSAALASRFSTAHADENCSDLNQVIARAERSIAEVAGRQVSVQFSLSSGATRVAVPFAELERIVLGLCAAARSLLSPGGRMVIETRGMNDAPLAAMSGVVSTAAPRARVLVRAEQLGNAPPPTPQREALTAQPIIGYSELEGLLERLGGRLEFVPLSADDIAYVAHLPYAAGGESSGRIAVAVPQEAGIILLVEDEPQVQAVTTRILRAFGYAVVTAHNERTALAQADQYGAAISLVVSDLVLPGVSGKDLVQRLQRPCEHARVLYISGYSPEHVGALSNGECFLRKPFTAQELLAVVRQLMPESVH
jgi:two-component system cell cycle sensor histidine kinase/response regulator CckA